MTLLTRRALLATPLLMTACAHTSSAPRQESISLALPGLPKPLRAWLQLPRGYDDDSRVWPLVVFLHGSGERGDDLDLVKVLGLPKQASAGRELPFILCAPQLDACADPDTPWDVATLHALLPALCARWRTDPARTSATGLSLGGDGVWHWAAAHPDDLAAIAPVCGHGDPARVCNARQVPVRAYHGSADTEVPLAAHQACVDALRACGGQVHFTVYPGVGHDAWTLAYEDPALLPWLTAQRGGAKS